MPPSARSERVRSAFAVRLRCRRPPERPTPTRQRSSIGLWS
jgi:hypothetical protein